MNKDAHEKQGGAELRYRAYRVSGEKRTLTRRRASGGSACGIIVDSSCGETFATRELNAFRCSPAPTMRMMQPWIIAYTTVYHRARQKNQEKNKAKNYIALELGGYHHP